MDWLKKNCGCRDLSLNELNVLSKLVKRPENLIKDKMAYDMLSSLATNSEQNSNRELPKSNVKKHLKNLVLCAEYRNATSISEEKLKEVWDLMISKEDYKHLFEKSDIEPRERLNLIFIECSARLVEDELYKMLDEKITEASKELLNKTN